jgi:hypothetical protein
MYRNYNHVRFVNPIITSFSRPPSRAEYFYMNRLEDHCDRCDSCGSLISGRFSADRCRRGSVLMNVVLRYLVIERNGKLYSTEDEYGLPVRIEVPRHYWAVHGLLRAFYPRHYRHTYISLYQYN